MNRNNKNLEQKKCGESCGCGSKQDSKNDASKVENEKTEELKPNPTRFGDWQVNGRAIDF